MEKIKYSEQAYLDGFDFSSFNEKEQEMTKDYYNGKENVREIDGLVKAADYYIHNHHFDFTATALIDYDWRFFVEGKYFAVIVNCTKSKKADSREYIIELMVDEYSIKYIKFDPLNFRSLLTNSIADELNFDERYYKLVGKCVCFEVKNISYGDNKTFAQINDFRFIEKEVIELFSKMNDIISDTCIKRRRAANR